MQSQNGWPLIDGSQLDTSPIPGTSIVPIPGTLGGDVGWLLRWVGTQFNATIAPLYTPGCWGWAPPTVIPGSSIYSNHGSGTAVDFNAPSFPWQTHTMTPAQRQACRNIIWKTDGVVAWGGDFTTVTDEMHFEINGTSEEVSAVVRTLKGEEMVTNESCYVAFQNARMRPPTKEELDQFVEKWTLESLDAALSEGDERKQVVKEWTTGHQALKDDWAGQIHRLVKEVQAEVSDTELKKKLDKIKEIVNE